MSLPEIIMAAIVVIVGVPAMWKNWTAVALVGSWAALQGVWLLTHQWSPMLELICDYGVLIAIFSKEERDHSPYRCLSSQLGAMWWQRSPPDRIIMSVFPIMWILYVSPVDAYYRWWGLWWLSIAQYIAVGCDSLGRWRAERRAEREAKTPPQMMRLGLAVHV